MCHKLPKCQTLTLPGESPVEVMQKICITKSYHIRVIILVYLCMICRNLRRSQFSQSGVGTGFNQMSMRRLNGIKIVECIIQQILEGKFDHFFAQI